MYFLTPYLTSRLKKSTFYFSSSTSCLFYFLDLKSLRSMVRNSLEQASDCKVNHLSLGDAEWNSALVKAALQIEFQQSWQNGEYLNFN